MNYLVPILLLSAKLLLTSAGYNTQFGVLVLISTDYNNPVELRAHRKGISVDYKTGNFSGTKNGELPRPQIYIEK